MRSILRGELAKLMAATTVWAMFISPSLATAQDHVVPLAEIERAARSKAEARAQNLADIDRVVGLPAAAKELERVKVSRTQVRAAVASLSDEELARLAAQARTAEVDVQGGFLVGILALIGLIVVIVIVLAVVT